MRSRIASGRGWLRRMHRGVYLVGPLEAPHSRAMAATLAAGAGAVLSHYSAAVLWGLRPPREGPTDVTVPGRKTRPRPGIRVHRGHLHPTDVTRHHGVPVTSPARTLLDLATTVTQRDLARATEEAQVQRRVSTHSLNEQFSRYPTHRGTAALRKAIRTDPALTRSEAERRLLALIRAARLPDPRGQRAGERLRSRLPMAASGDSSSRSTVTRSTHRAARSSATALATRCSPAEGGGWCGSRGGRSSRSPKR